MKKLVTFVYAILAGVSIALGATAYLSVESKVAGSVYFTVGLFIILTQGFNLFTSKICYVFDRDREYRINLPIIYVGNVIGVVGMGLIARQTRLSTTIAEHVHHVVELKLNDTLLSVFILAIFCNILIYVAVNGFVNHEHGAAKYLSLFLAIPAFIVAGFEHCIANMFYFTVAGVWSGRTVLYVFVITLGNMVGGMLIPVVRKLLSKAEAKVVSK